MRWYRLFPTAAGVDIDSLVGEAALCGRPGGTATEMRFRFQSIFAKLCRFLHSAARIPHMSTSAPPFTVRSDYVYQLAGACQRFVGSLLVLEPAVLISAARQLLSDTPVAQSPAEALVTW